MGHALFLLVQEEPLLGCTVEPTRAQNGAEPPGSCSPVWCTTLVHSDSAWLQSGIVWLRCNSLWYGLVQSRSVCYAHLRSGTADTEGLPWPACWPTFAS